MPGNQKDREEAELINSFVEQEGTSIVQYLLPRELDHLLKETGLYFKEYNYSILLNGFPEDLREYLIGRLDLEKRESITRRQNELLTKYSFNQIPQITVSVEGVKYKFLEACATYLFELSAGTGEIKSVDQLIGELQYRKNALKSNSLKNSNEYKWEIIAANFKKLERIIPIQFDIYTTPSFEAMVTGLSEIYRKIARRQISHLEFPTTGFDETTAFVVQQALLKEKGRGHIVLNDIRTKVNERLYSRLDMVSKVIDCVHCVRDNQSTFSIWQQLNKEDNLSVFIELEELFQTEDLARVYAYRENIFDVALCLCHLGKMHGIMIWDKVLYDEYTNIPKDLQIVLRKCFLGYAIGCGLYDIADEHAMFIKRIKKHYRVIERLLDLFYKGIIQNESWGVLLMKMDAAIPIEINDNLYRGTYEVNLLNFELGNCEDHYSCFTGAKGCDEFEKLANLKNEEVKTLLKNISDLDFKLALKACSEKTARKLISNLFPGAVPKLFYDLYMKGPVRESDVIKSQTTIVAVSKKLKNRP